MPVVDEGDSIQVLKPPSNIYLLTYIVISQAMKNENEESL